MPEQTALELIGQAIEIMAELEAIKKRPMNYALDDLAEWMDKRLPLVGELQNEAYELLHPDYPDNQAIFNFHVVAGIEKVSA